MKIIMSFTYLLLSMPLFALFCSISDVPMMKSDGANSVVGDIVRDSVREVVPKKHLHDCLMVSLPLNEIIITSPFGIRKDPITGKLKRHNGLDLYACNDDVYAMFPGIVEKVGEDKTSGKYVILRHNDCLIGYCHLSKVLVDRRNIVRAGEVVGVTGNTGRSTGEHLHMTCTYKGKYLNPIALLQYVLSEKIKANTILTSN